MQISPIPTLDDETNQIRSLTAEIVADHIIPNEHQLTRRGDPKTGELWAELTAMVKSKGLWAPHLPEEYGGMGIGFLKLAYMNEILAWSPLSNPLFGIMAPNSGNQKILVKYGTPEQKKQWLEPLIEGSMQSCFAMTEPDNPDPIPGHCRPKAVRDGDDWVISGHKWMASNAKRADFAIVMELLDIFVGVSLIVVRNVFGFLYLCEALGPPVPDADAPLFGKLANDFH